MTTLEPVFVETIPAHLESGKLYITTKYGTAAHLCPRGCGEKVPIPIVENSEIGDGHAWSMTRDGDLVTLKPSLSNRFACKSHYWIRRNEVVWA